jgi:hypothetical protein
MRPRSKSATEVQQETFLVENGWHCFRDGWHHASLRWPWPLEAAYRLTSESHERSRSLRASCEAWRATDEQASMAGHAKVAG